MKNMKFKKGDIVYHTKAMRFGTFIEYTCDDECLVAFKDEDGHEDCKAVAVSQLCLSADFNISSVGFFHPVYHNV